MTAGTSLDSKRFERFPASKAQQQLFFVQKLLGNASTYHVPVFLQLRGRIDPDALRRAVTRVAERHESLRTQFEVRDDRLWQLVDEDWELDWCAGSCESGGELDLWMAQEESRPFDLERGPLFRAALMLRGSRRGVLLLAMHHIVCDGWSVDVILDEVLRCYAAFVRSKEPELPEPAFQYGDYACWHEEWLNSPAAARQVDYWARVLAGDLPVVRLPRDRSSEPSAASGGSVVLDLHAETIDRLRGLAQSSDATLFVGLLAAFKVVLAAYTDLEDVVVGIPTANRSRPEFRATVGFFVNTLAIRTGLDMRSTFREVLGQVLASTLDAYDHQEVPFETVVSRVNPARDLDTDPVFQVLFMMNDIDSSSSEVEGLHVEPVTRSSKTSKFQLSLEVSDVPGQPSAVIEYRADLFSPGWIQRFAAHYCEAVRAAVDHPDRPLSDVVVGIRESVPPGVADTSVPVRAPEPLDTVFVAPRDPTERLLAKMWAEVLELPQVGIDDNWFVVGGDSIRCIQILSRARQLGVEIRLQDLMLHQTVRELAPTVREAVPKEVTAVTVFGLLAEHDRKLVPTGIEDAYPLTSLQVGMLYHGELSGVRHIYHNVVGYHLRAPYVPDAWRAAVESLVARHEMLRTSFSLDGFSEPVQLVHPEIRPPITFEDLSQLPPAEQDEALGARFRWERDHPFDWTRPPLIRFHVQRRSPDTVHLWVTEHHAIMDGWSARLLFAELLRLVLNALGRGVGEILPPPVARFRSLVAAERAAVASPVSASFWTDALRGSTPTLVPRSVHGPGADTPAGSDPDMRMIAREWPDGLSAQIITLAKRVAVSPRTLLLAVHLKVMSLVGGMLDVVTGVVYNGRLEEADGDRVVGLHLNTLPFRFEVNGGSWGELVEQVARHDRDIQSHRRFPMSEIQARLGGTTLFDTFFNYTHFHVAGTEPGEEVAVLDEDGVVPVSFSFGAEFFRDALSDRIGLGLRYDAGQFSAEHIERIHGYYATAVRAAVDDVDADHGAVLLLGREELAQLVRWNDTAVDHDTVHLLPWLLQEQASATPQNPSVTFEGVTLSYAELDQQANQMAHRLVARGVRPGSFVGVCLDRSATMVVALLAILKAGGAYLPLPTDNPPLRIAEMVSLAGPTLVLTQPDLRERLWHTDVPLELVSGPEENWRQCPRHPPDVRLRSQDPAYLFFTSGSTGQPKGVVVSHHAICNRLLWMQDEFGLAADDCVMQKTPFSFDVSVWEFFWPLMQGARLVLARPGGHRDPTYLTYLMRDEGVTTVHFVPSMLRAFLQHGRVEECDRLRRVVCSGEALPYELAEDFVTRSPARLSNLYGPTEAAVDVSCWHVRPHERRLVPIGRPIANVTLHVLDPAMAPVPIGSVGELYIGGAGLADGYRGRPDLTAERFLQRTDEHGALQRVYRTGDLARHLADGELEYLGRVDQQVQLRGQRIELEEVESVLGQHEHVCGAAVTLKDDRLIGYIVTVPDARLDTHELRSHTAERLPDYMVPSAWVFLAEFPLSRHGKLDRARLPDPRREDMGRTRELVAPESDTQRRLVTLWEEVLGVSPISINDTFFELGGHSLLALRLVMLIRKEFRRELPVVDLLTHSTVARLERVLKSPQLAGSDAARLVPLRRTGDGSPLTLVHPVGGGVFCYLPLVAELRPDRPVLGLVSEGLASGSVLHRTVEEIAASYVELLKARQSEGPYHLGGWSFGAVISFEMACQLRAAGDSVGALCMVDAAYPGAFEDELDDENMALLLFFDVMRAAGMDLPTDVEEEWAAGLTGLDTLTEKMRWLVDQLEASGHGQGWDPVQWQAYFAVFSTNLLAHDRYRPSEYAGDVTYLEGLDGAEVNSAEGWRQSVSGEMSVHTVPASHYDVLRAPYVREAAGVMDASLCAVPDGQASRDQP